MDLKLLDQNEVWVDAAGEERPLADLEISHCRNIVNFLRRRAEGISVQYSRHLMTVELSLVHASENAYDAVSAEIDQQFESIMRDPMEWLNNKPLIRALEARVEEYATAQRDLEGYL